MNSSNVSYIELGDELKNINNDNFQSNLQQIGSGDTRSRRSADKNRVKDRNEQQKRQNNGYGRISERPRFLQDNKAVEVKNTTTRIK